MLQKTRGGVTKMKLLNAIFWLSSCTLLSRGSRPLHKTDVFEKLDQHVPNNYTYKTFYFQVPMDHFGYANQDTFKMRYLVADQFWDKNGGPIFFYAGNEGDIEMFCNNTGFMWDIAPEFKALLVFAEHRYYGKSLPYGDQSYKDITHVGYLSSEQALADYTDLLTYMKANLPGANKSPVIAFGGSYGGMLAAWFRMKYPHIVTGSLAASAPILWFGNLTACNAFYNVTTRDFEREDKNCPKNIRKSWDVINKMGTSAKGRSFLSQTMKLCKPLKDVDDVNGMKAWLVETYGNLAMVDYPYPTSFLEPLPGWPIKEVCSYLHDSGMSDEQLIQGIAEAISVYYNHTGTARCFNTSQQGLPTLGDLGWSFQACSEMVMPMCSDGVTDMFEPVLWNLTSYAQGCKDQWQVTPRPNWALEVYGGKNIATASNIIFSNGRLDPWSGGGVLQNISESLVSIIIDEGAHHLDLRGSNPADPASVIQARNQEKQIIKQWIAQYKAANSEIDTDINKDKTGTYIVIAVLGTVALAIIILGIVIMTRHDTRWNQQLTVPKTRLSFGVDSPAPCVDSTGDSSVFSSPSSPAFRPPQTRPNHESTPLLHN